jgi:hypothetical protein
VTALRDLTAWTAPLPLAAPGRRGAIRTRSLAILSAQRDSERLSRTIPPRRSDIAPSLTTARLLLDSVAARDPDAAAHAADGLLGLGPGLTPEGDDLIAGAAAAVYAFAAAAGWSATAREAWLAAVAPADLERRTTPLSAELLTRVCRGEAFVPMCELLDVSSAGEPGWWLALARLTAIGASTGRAYARAAGAAAYLITTGQGDRTCV